MIVAWRVVDICAGKIRTNGRAASHTNHEFARTRMYVICTEDGGRLDCTSHFATLSSAHNYTQLAVMQLITQNESDRSTPEGNTSTNAPSKLDGLEGFSPREGPLLENSEDPLVLIAYVVRLTQHLKQLTLDSA